MSERIVHIGLGAFFRAHQAWYTQESDPNGEWQIVAYTGRSAEAADQLNAQGCKYTLIVRGADSDQFQQISAISRAVPGSDLADLIQTMTNPELAIVTLTITEAAYLVDENLPLEQSAIGRLALALEGRRIAQAGTIALVPCDNMPENGSVLKHALAKLGGQIGTEFIDYLDSSVSFVSTSVDRITPKTTEAEIRLLAEKSISDQSPVVTEPFSDWVLSGEFPNSRPNWELAGAKFVSNITPFENRKLWLLNGSHTLLAVLGSLRGHQTVAEAISDSVCRNAVMSWWNSAGNYLTLPELNIPQYRSALISRYENPRIEHRLNQIANDSSLKLALRLAPVALMEYENNRIPNAVITAFAAWIIYCQNNSTIVDKQKTEISAALSESNFVEKMISLVSEDLAENSEFVRAVGSTIESLENTQQPVHTEFGNSKVLLS